MEVVPLDSAAEVAALAADTIEALVRSHPSAVLGLATGSSPVATYAELVARHRAGTGPSYDDVRATARAALIDTFIGHPSASVQHTLYAMGEAVIGACPDVDAVRLRMPNKHHVPVDLSALGLTNTHAVNVTGLDQVIAVHVLKNIMIPVVTVVGLEFGGTIAFSVVTESIFAWPGMGKLIIDSINVLDRPVIVAYLMIIVLMFIVINLVVDLTYSVLDPRVRLEAKGA